MTASDGRKKTPLHDRHVAAGGRMVPFAGFEMPVQYTSLAEEHRAVRERAGLFDVSHMGEITVSGPRALELVQRISCNDHSKMAVGRASYTALMTPSGTFVDDMLVHRTGESDYLLVVNAANVDKDFVWVAEVAAGEEGVEVANRSDDWAQIALQGPRAAEVLDPLVDVDLSALKYYRFTEGEVAGRPALIARTGYTGEDGFELYTAPGDAGAVWDAILEAGAPHGVVPAGLGARDTLRLEAGMPLYGNDIDDTTTPLEAGLGWIVKLAKDDFIGKDVLEEQAENGVERTLVGFEATGRGIPRHGHPIAAEEGGETIGEVTSGTMSPSLGRAIGMAYVPPERAEPGTELVVDVRGRAVPIRVAALPFVSGRKKAKPPTTTT